MSNKVNKGKYLTIDDKINILNELIKGTKLSLISEKKIQLLFLKKYPCLGFNTINLGLN